MRVLQPGGWLLVGVLNAHSVLALTTSHDETFRHAKFLTPEELTGFLEAEGLKVTDVSGLSFTPGRGFAIGDDVKMDYFVTAVRA